jgi:hypothetical protein
MTKAQFNQKVDEFFNKWDDKKCDFDGVYGGQCVDVIKQFFADVIGVEPKARGNAVDYWDHCPELDKIPNSPTAVPEKGDVIIWGTGIGQYGHIALAKGVGDTNKFDSFDQNYPIGSPCHFQNHTYKAVLGWLRARNINDPEPVVTPEPPKPNIDTRDVKIAELQNQLLDSTKLVDELNKKLETAQKTDDDLSAKLKKATEDIVVLNEDKTALEAVVEGNEAIVVLLKEEVQNLKDELKSKDNIVVMEDKPLSDEDRKQIAITYIKEIFTKIFKKK